MRQRAQPGSVIIVGAGPVGLLLACELGLRNVPVTVLDEKPGLVRHPRANTQGARTMEIYRRHGIAQHLRRTGLPPDRATDVAYFTRLFGHELHRVALPSPDQALAAAMAGDPRWPTPEPQYRISQMEVEPALLRRAQSFPSVDVRFGMRVTGLAQTANAVQLAAEPADGGNAREISANFLVGCDGGRSFVRRELGIRLAGQDALNMDFMGGRMLASYIRAPGLLARFPHPETWMHWQMQPGGRSIFIVLDPERHEFLVHFQLDASQEFDFGQKFTAMVGEAVPFEILSQAEWRAGLGLVAETYSAGNCFLAGDAAHLFTPTGGYGLNTGIEDAFNLGWKLAAVCNGIAGPGLLATFEAERRPIAVRNTANALELAKRAGSCPVSPALDDDTPEGERARAATAAHLRKFARHEFDTPGIQLGARYDGSPIILGDGGAPPPDSPTQYLPSDLPGGRLPHAWLADGGALFDRLGAEFTLVLFRPAAAAAAWSRAARARGLELAVLDLSGEPGCAAVTAAAALLVRPDQHIAWRGALDADPAEILPVVIGDRLPQPRS